MSNDHKFSIFKKEWSAYQASPLKCQTANGSAHLLKFWLSEREST